MSNLQSQIQPTAEVRKAETLEYFRAEFAALGKRHIDEWNALSDRFKASNTWKGAYSSWESAEAAMSAIFEAAYYQSPADNPKAKENVIPLDYKQPPAAPRYCPQSEESPVASKATKAQPEESGCRDATGFPIPKTLQDSFKRRQEVTGMEYYASRVAAFLEGCQEQKDALYTHLYHTGFVQHLANHAKTVRHAISQCIPDVVCPDCGGVPSDCDECHGCGWISKERWEQNWVASKDKLRMEIVKRRAE